MSCFPDRIVAATNCTAQRYFQHVCTAFLEEASGAGLHQWEVQGLQLAAVPSIYNSDIF